MTLLWFTGMYMEKCSDDEKKFLRRLKKKLQTLYSSVKTMCFAPPLTYAGRGYGNINVWANYDPEEGETYRNTCNTNAGQWFPYSASHLYSTLNSIEGDCLFMGFSNGAVPAMEFAKYYAPGKQRKGPITKGVILFNGCPQWKKIDEHRREPQQFPVQFFLSDQDDLWDEHQKLYKVAWSFGANIFRYKGRHGALPPEYFSFFCSTIRTLLKYDAEVRSSFTDDFPARLSEFHIS